MWHELCAIGWVRAKLRFGLALFDGAVVDQNFVSHAGRLERLTDLLRNGPRHDRLGGVPGVERKTIGLGIERQTVLILCGNTIRAMGEGRGHIFLKGNGDRTITWRTIGPGDDPLVIAPSSAVAKGRELETAAQNKETFNPFGLPTSADAKPRGTVVLHGGAGKGDHIDWYPKLTQSPKPRIVLCPAGQAYCRPSAECNGEALNRRLEQYYAPWRQLQVAGRAGEIAFLTTATAADANRADFVEPLTRADAVWFGGGDQKWLADLFVDRHKPTLVQQEILGVLRRGGVVGGASAGLAIMPEVMIEGGESVDGRPAKASLSRGLGVLKHVLAEQHFDARTGRIERFTGLLRDHRQLANFSPTSRPRQMIGLAVEEDTAFIAQGNRLRVVGRKLAHVFLQASDPSVVTWHAQRPGDSAVVRLGANGYELELEDWVFDSQK